MALDYFFKGILIGFSIAAPVGPIGILTVQRSLRHGTMAGLATGMGAASADAVYGCVAGFGLTFVSKFLLAWNTFLLWAGGLFLSILGIGLLLKKPENPSQTGPVAFTTYPSAYFSALFLTLTNPMTIMAFTAIFAGLGLGMTAESYASAGLLVFGVFLGSSIWWLILAFGVGQLKKKLNQGFMTALSLTAGVILLGFGCWSLFFAAG